MNTARFLKYIWPFFNIMKETVKVNLEKKNFEKETLAQVFSCEFCEISKNIFFAEQLRTTASKIIQKIITETSEAAQSFFPVATFQQTTTAY